MVAGQGEKDDLSCLIVAYQLRHDFRITQVGIIVIYNDRPNILLWQRKIKSFYPDIRIRILTEREIEPFGNPEELFLNVNEHEHYLRMKRLNNE